MEDPEAVPDRKKLTVEEAVRLGWLIASLALFVAGGILLVIHAL